MALFAAAARNLRSEVVARIRDIVPSSRSTRRFKTYPDRAAVLKPINQFTGTPRMFFVGSPSEVKQTYFGKSIVGRLYEFPITFAYQRSVSWGLAAIDDMDKIRYDFLSSSNAHGVTGVANRHIDPDKPVIIEPNAEDPWDYHTIRLLAWFELDHA